MLVRLSAVTQTGSQPADVLLKAVGPGPAMRVVQGAILHLVDMHVREPFCGFNLVASYASSRFEWLQNRSSQSPSPHVL